MGQITAEHRYPLRVFVIVPTTKTQRSIKFQPRSTRPPAPTDLRVDLAREEGWYWSSPDKLKFTAIDVVWIFIRWLREWVGFESLWTTYFHPIFSCLIFYLCGTLCNSPKESPSLFCSTSMVIPPPWSVEKPIKKRGLFWEPLKYFNHLLMKKLTHIIWFHKVAVFL